jgi:hypothetical protein
MMTMAPKNVLMAGNDLTFNKVVFDILRYCIKSDHGTDSKICHSSEDSINAMKHGYTPDVVLLDAGLFPLREDSLNPFVIANYLRKNNYTGKIIVLSAINEEYNYSGVKETFQKYKDYSIKHLEKPCRLNDMLDQILSN